MNKFKKSIIISILVTLPISIIFIVTIVQTMNIYFDSDKIFFLNDKGNRLHKLGLTQYNHMKNQLSSVAGFKKDARVNLLVKNSDLNQLNSHLPRSGFADKKGFGFIDNTLYKGKVRYRGDNYYHWLYKGKSWRFKTSKNNLYKGTRKINFIIPKYNGLLNNHLSYELAKSLNLLSPDSTLTDISINGKYNGIKLQVEQVDESFLRKNRRMPNDIYKGDNMGEKSYKGLSVSLFNNATIWDKASANNHYDLSSLIPLNQLIKDIKTYNYQLYSLKEFAALGVFIDMAETYHMDKQHNWTLYYDNYYEKMYPIVNDPLGWVPEWRGYNNTNIITSELLESLYYNYDFMREKYKIVKDFFNNESENFKNKKSNAILNAHKLIKKNEYTIAMGNINLNMKDSLNAVNVLNRTIDEKLHKVKEYFLGKVDKNKYKYTIEENKIRLYIDGNKLVKSIRLKSKTSMKDIKNITLSIQQNNKIYKYDISHNSALILDNELKINTKLLPNINIEKINNNFTWKKASFTPVTYDIEIKDLTLDVISNVKLTIDNLKEEEINLERVENIAVYPFSDRLINIIDFDKKNTTQLWSSEKNIHGFNIIKSDIVIKPGTKIIFDENATLKVLGKVTAIGTKENPIIFAAKDKTKPWNAFALKDAKANGSVFKHCIFKDGSGDKGDLYEYTAMFSIHNVKDLLVEDCEFYDSKRTDDMVHVIYSDATFKNTKFVRSLSDALDVDISNLFVDNCEFIDSGNDSIDLMTTNAIVTNTKFTNSKDKSISIGEGSNLLAANNYIKGSEIGMQSKDTSQAYIYNTSFIANKKAVDAYHKNWRYSEGGTIILDQCIFEKNIINATVGKKSKVVINSSNIDTPNKFDTKSLRKKKIIISDDGPIKHNLKESLFKDKTHLKSKKQRGYHE